MRSEPSARRREWLGERLDAVGRGAVVRPPFHCDYGYNYNYNYNYNVFLGEDVFLDFNCLILDVCKVSIGDGTQIGPAVHLYAPDHPRDAVQRAAGLEFGRPLTISRNVWIGGGAIVLPGATMR